MSEAEMQKLFCIFDRKGGGRIELNLLKKDFAMLGMPAKTLEALHNWDQNADGFLDLREFIGLMRSATPNMFDAVSFDVDQGLLRYNRITDHTAFPISVLINRTAFAVLFPDPRKKKEPTDPTEEQLEELRIKFFELLSYSKSVVFARAEPAMKKRMVTEIMARVAGCTALAIGDGANDTDMITAAHVGVGIAGVEGTAATNAADYAIGTFRLLHTLLFVHGFWNYHRISGMVHFLFYKAALLAFSGYFFGFFSGFSAQLFFNDPIYQLYNVVFTALPVAVTAVVDRRVPRESLEDQPFAYRAAKGRAFTRWSFAGWIFRAATHGALMFFFPYAIMGSTITHEDGKMNDLFLWSTVVYSGTVLTPTFLVLFTMYSVTLIHVVAVVLSVLSFYVATYILSLLLDLNTSLYGTIARLYIAPTFWLCVVVTVSIPLLVELALKSFQSQFSPTFTDLLRERSSLNQSTDNNFFQAQVASAKSGEESGRSRHPPTSSSLPHSWNWGKTTKKPERTEVEENQTIVHAMLTFRSLTGSHFDSATNDANNASFDAPMPRSPTSVRRELTATRGAAGEFPVDVFPVTIAGDNDSDNNTSDDDLRQMLNLRKLSRSH
jgi:hypothetical protein